MNDALRRRVLIIIQTTKKSTFFSQGKDVVYLNDSGQHIKTSDDKHHLKSRFARKYQNDI